ncbi:MAG: hypothetical protein JWQ73_962 [Variovorax sp.]|nr:hypothetical protein [Variovorax sp.]
MNNSLDRLLDGICAALRRDVIPRLDDEYATGQALAVIDLINNLKPRLDWAVPPLVERARSQQALVAELDRVLGAGGSGRPRFDAALDSLPVDGRGLQALCDRLDAHVGATVRWLGAAGPVTTADPMNGSGPPADPAQHGEAADAARAAISRHVHAELRRDMALTPRPLFAEIARGTDANHSSAPSS